jgi:hypothetical protein
MSRKNQRQEVKRALNFILNKDVLTIVEQYLPAVCVKCSKDAEHPYRNHCRGCLKQCVFQSGRHFKCDVTGIEEEFHIDTFGQMWCDEHEKLMPWGNGWSEREQLSWQCNQCLDAKEYRKFERETREDQKFLIRKGISIGAATGVGIAAGVAAYRKKLEPGRVLTTTTMTTVAGLGFGLTAAACAEVVLQAKKRKLV